MAPSAHLPRSRRSRKGETTTMSDVINSIFGRSKYDAPRTGDYTGASTPAQPDTIESDNADVVATDETLDTKAIEDEVTESPAETDVEPADAEATDDADIDIDIEADRDDDQADDGEAADDDAEDDVAGDDESVEGEPMIEGAADESDEAVTADDTAELADEDGGIAEEAEPIAVESDDAPVPVAAETDEDDNDQAESIVEPVPAEARPAAGTRGSTTVGDGVVTKIVTLVARKAEGVHGLGEEGISVEVDGDVATIKVSLVVEFGHAVNALAEQVRVNVIEAVEQFLGLDVAVVDVHVTDIHIPDAG